MLDFLFFVSVNCVCVGGFCCVSPFLPFLILKNFVGATCGRPHCCLFFRASAVRPYAVD